MASSRDTRCISAAFDFLNTTDFCQRCRPGDQEHCLDSDSDLTDSSIDLMGLKPSQSDTALLQYQENGEREERRVVCLCQEREVSCDLDGGGGGRGDGDFLQGYIDRHAAGTQEGRENGGGQGPEMMENNIPDDKEAQPTILDKDKNGVVSINQTQTTDLQYGRNTNCVSGGGQLREDSPGAHIMNSDGAKESSAAPHPGHEDEEEEVEMRPNRHLLHRRSTDTGLISSAFEFLPSTDSVFLPSTGGAVHRTGKTHTSASMPSAEECGPGGRDNDHGSECCGAEVCAEDRGRRGVLNNGGCVGKDRGSDRDDVGEKLKDTDGTKTDSMECNSEEDGAPVRLRRRPISKQDSIMEDEGSGDSSDDDAGVYAESFRRSNWVRIDDDGQLELAFPAVNQARLSRSSAASENSRSSSWPTDITDCGQTPGPKVTSDESTPVPGQSPSPRLYRFHKRSDSNSTTLSEKEFKKEYVARRKCLIQRQNSSKEYHRFSANVYEEEKTVSLEKGPGEQDFGLHILDSQPAYITRVVPGSAAERGGVEEGQILVSVNGTNVLSSSHDDIVALIINSPSLLQVAIATSDFQPSRDLQAALMEGHMQKLGGSSSVIMRRWKKRYFVLRQDSCLYYYKQKEDNDPLGAIPLVGYTFSRHLDSGRDYCFKAEKYGARTYYFMTESRDIMTEWVGALSEAAARSKNRKESFVSVSSHNVGLPALDIRRPECTGYLLKVGNRRKTWNRRYCVLKDACLYYYKNVNSLSALGVAHLHGYKVDPSISISKRHAFALVPPLDSLRTFQFSADNDTDRQRWVQAMIRSIQRWIQIDNDC